MQEGTPSTRDTLFLAVTRPATVYGVPLKGFLFAVTVAALCFSVSHRYGILWRMALCGGSAVAALGVMRALTSWEPRWWELCLTWVSTCSLDRLSSSFWSFGGSTYRPWPSSLRKDRREMRDYRG